MVDRLPTLRLGCLQLTAVGNCPPRAGDLVRQVALTGEARAEPVLGRGGGQLSDAGPPLFECGLQGPQPRVEPALLDGEAGLVGEESGPFALAGEQVQRLELRED